MTAKARWLPVLVLSLLGMRGTTSAASSTTPTPAPPELFSILSESREREVALRLQAIAAERETQQQLLIAQGQAYVRLLRLGLLPLGGGFDGLVRHASTVSGLSQAIQRRVVAIEQLDAQAGALKQGLVEARRQREATRADLSDYQRSRDAIMAAREREAAYRRAFGGGGQSATAVYSGTHSGAEEASSFIEAKGRLPLPVEGRAEVNDVPATTERGPAVRLRVDLGAVARSVFAGRVVLIGAHDGGGRAVVVDHGGGYSTLVGKLRRVHVQAGDEVARGAVLGETMNVDGHGEIYFEVRKDGVNVFPADWFGI